MQPNAHARANTRQGGCSTRAADSPRTRRQGRCHRAGPPGSRTPCCRRRRGTCRSRGTAGSRRIWRGVKGGEGRHSKHRAAHVDGVRETCEEHLVCKTVCNGMAARSRACAVVAPSPADCTRCSRRRRHRWGPPGRRRRTGRWRSRRSRSGTKAAGWEEQGREYAQLIHERQSTGALQLAISAGEGLTGGHRGTACNTSMRGNAARHSCVQQVHQHRCHSLRPATARTMTTHWSLTQAPGPPGVLGQVPVQPPLEQPKEPTWQTGCSRGRQGSTRRQAQAAPAAQGQRAQGLVNGALH